MKRNKVPMGFFNWLLESGKYKNDSIMEKIDRAIRKM